MSRPLRIAFPGAIYHVTSRGNARAAVFIGDEDRQQFLRLLAKCIERFNWICHAYCLMDNHYHLLIETPDANLKEGMRQLNGVYTQKFNHAHGRVGHVFQGRYKAILVDKNSYLLELCRYIVLNPVRAKMVTEPGLHAWSSYNATLGRTNCPAWLQTDWLLQQFASRKTHARQRYAEFVAQGIGQESPWKKLKGQILLGDETFVECLRPFLDDNDKLSEVPRTQKMLARPELSELFPAEVRLNKVARNTNILQAFSRHGYSMASIAKHLDLHYTTVSKVIVRGSGK